MAVGVDVQRSDEQPEEDEVVAARRMAETEMELQSMETPVAARRTTPAGTRRGMQVWPWRQRREEATEAEAKAVVAMEAEEGERRRPWTHLL